LHIVEFDIITVRRAPAIIFHLHTHNNKNAVRYICWLILRYKLVRTIDITINTYVQFVLRVLNTEAFYRLSVCLNMYLVSHIRVISGYAGFLVYKLHEQLNCVCTLHSEFRTDCELW